MVKTCLFTYFPSCPNVLFSIVILILSKLLFSSFAGKLLPKKEKLKYGTVVVRQRPECILEIISKQSL